MMTPESIIRRPIFLTEKSNTLRGKNQVVFEVLRGANKVQIDPFAIPLAEAGPVITINVQGVGPNRQDEQQAAQQERTNHVPMFPLRCCRQQTLSARRHAQAYR